MNYTIIHCHRVLTVVNLLFCARTGRTPRPVYSNAPRNSPFRNEYIAVDLGNLKDNNGHNEIKKQNKTQTHYHYYFCLYGSTNNTTREKNR